MLANQVLNKFINDIYDIMNIPCSVWDRDGICKAYVEERNKEAEPQVRACIIKREDCNYQLFDDCACFALYDEEEFAGVLVLHGYGQELKQVGTLFANQLVQLIMAYKTRKDKNHFYQNLILDNLLVVDIFNQAKKLGIENEENRVVFLVEPINKHDELVLEAMKGVYLTGTKDFITAVDDGHVIYVKSLEKTDDYDTLNEVAKTIVTTMNTEAMVGVRVSYGTIVNQLKDVSKSYKEASIALDVGRVFYSEKTVLAYNRLGIGRLIHQLPYHLCEMFLKEVFDGKAIEQFDDEILTTVNQLFANNLNISETARQVVVHRNTLVYRLEKIQKITGLDVRVFDEALLFKIALMVSMHMKSNE